MEKEHQSGFVNIIGRPNVGKSTLLNVLMGERMSIITNKPQTTRHRIIGIMDDPGYQVVFSDTPGVIEDPAYKMQVMMNNFVKETFEDGDVMLFVTEVNEKYELNDPILRRLQSVDVPLFLIINKIDLATPERIVELIQYWNDLVPFAETFPISALNKQNTDRIIEFILKYLPEGPKYYPSDQFTDRSERFFVSEIIREKILLLYEQEVPYSVEVVVQSFKEGVDRNKKEIVRIEAEIYVARKTQKSIIIGKQGQAIKKLGIESRKAIETFLEKRAHLELFVKIKEKWRDDDKQLKHFGYK